MRSVRVLPHASRSSFGGTMKPTHPSTKKRTDSELVADIAENAYGDYYVFYRCAGCGAEGGERWQARAECRCR